jgi:hypothetical protein
MANRSAAGSRLIDRRTVLQVAAALAAAGPALMREGHAATRPPVVIDAQVHASGEQFRARRRRLPRRSPKPAGSPVSISFFRKGRGEQNLELGPHPSALRQAKPARSQVSARGRLPAQRFVPDSPLEGAGFEPSVPATHF